MHISLPLENPPDLRLLRACQILKRDRFDGGARRDVMKIEWLIEPNEIARVKAFVAEHWENPFVQDRIRRNLRPDKPPVSKAEFWDKHVGCLLTTQQRSGPKSAVSRFITKPFPLSHEACSKEADVEAFCLTILKNFGGLRRSSVISREVAANTRPAQRGRAPDRLPAP